MNECTYLGRICTDLVLNKKEKRIQIFLTVLLLVQLQRESVLMQKKVDGFVYVVRTERIISKKMV